MNYVMDFAFHRNIGLSVGKVQIHLPWRMEPPFIFPARTIQQTRIWNAFALHCLPDKGSHITKFCYSDDPYSPEGYRQSLQQSLDNFPTCIYSCARPSCSNNRMALVLWIFCLRKLWINIFCDLCGLSKFSHCNRHTYGTHTNGIFIFFTMSPVLASSFSSCPLIFVYSLYTQWYTSDCKYLLNQQPLLLPLRL